MWQPPITDLLRDATKPMWSQRYLPSLSTSDTTSRRPSVVASPAGDMEASPDIDKSQMTVLERDPQNLETPLERLTTWITPAEWFYVRTHNDTPTLDAPSWHMRVDGLVQHPLSLTLADLKQFPVIEEVVTLKCSGNGRAFYEPKIKGVQWRKGGVGPPAGQASVWRMCWPAQAYTLQGNTCT